MSYRETMQRRDSPPLTSSNAPARRLILVEDDESVRRSMTMLLRTRGFQIDAYRSASEFLMMTGQHDGDCLLIDYKMPRIDGIELIQRIRRQKDETPAIMVTGYYSDSLKQRALVAGFAEVLEKPLVPKRIQSLISKVTR